MDGAAKRFALQGFVVVEYARESLPDGLEWAWGTR